MKTILHGSMGAPSRIDLRLVLVLTVALTVLLTTGSCPAQMVHFEVRASRQIGAEGNKPGFHGDDFKAQREMTLEIKVRPLSQAASDLRVEVFFIAKDVVTKDRFVYDSQAFRLAPGWVEFEARSKKVEETVKRSTSYPDRDHYIITRVTQGSRPEGWIARLKSGDRILKTEVSLQELSNFEGQNRAAFEALGASIKPKFIGASPQPSGAPAAPAMGTAALPKGLDQEGARLAMLFHADIRNRLGKLLLHETFDDNHRKWPENSGSGGAASVEGGAYHVSKTTPGRCTYRTIALPHSDVAILANMRIPSVKPGSASSYDENWFGLVFRRVTARDDATLYRLCFDASRREDYSLSLIRVRHTPKDQRQKIAQCPYPLEKLAGRSFCLQALASQGRFAAYLDGVKMFEGDDRQPFLSGGNLGIIIGDTTELVVEDLIVFSLAQ